MAELALGQEAPDFTLADEARQPVHLADLRGRPVVLMFYPLDFSPVCTGEMCEIRDRFPDLESAGARLLGISRDSVWTHKAFKEQQGLKHTLLADMKGDVARLYGAWNENAGLAERLTVVVDRQGKITFMDRSPSIPTPRDQQKMLDAIKGMAAGA
jgi:peroxiredoxin